MDKAKNLILNSLTSIKYDLFFWIITLSLLVKQTVFMKWCVHPSSWTDLLFNFISNPRILIYLAYSLILTSICFLFSKRFRIWYLILLDFFVSCIIIWSTLKFRMTSSYFSVLISYDTMPLNIIKEILSYLRPTDLILLFDILILYPFALFFKDMYAKCKRSVFSTILILILNISYIGSIYYKVDVKNYTNHNQQLYFNDWADDDRQYSLGIIGHELRKWFNYVIDYSKLSKNDEKEIDDFFDNKAVVTKNNYFGKFKNKNIVFLQLESFEPLVLNQKIDGEEITPNLNKLLNNSIYFPNIYPNNNSGVSSDCDFLINTGLYPSRSGQTFYDFPHNQYPNALPKLLKNSNYYSVSYHCDYGYYWNVYENLAKFGFDEIFNFKDFKKTENFSMGVPDHEFLPQVAEKLSKLPKPFFAHTITVSGHSPFFIPDNHKKLTLPSRLNNTVMGDFLQTARYTDEAIGNFVKDLDSLNLSDDTVLFIYGDHGGIHKYHNDKLKAKDDLESWWLGDEKIPLIIYNKNLKGTVNETFGGQIDFYPTLSYLLGVEPENYKYVLGKNLFNTDNNYVNVNGKIYGNNDSKIKDDENYSLKINQLILEKNYLNKKLAR